MRKQSNVCVVGREGKVGGWVGGWTPPLSVFSSLSPFFFFFLHLSLSFSHSFEPFGGVWCFVGLAGPYIRVDIVQLLSSSSSSSHQILPIHPFIYSVHEF